jgi:hypothetical protein
MGAVWAQCWSGSRRLTPSQADRDRDRPAAGEPASKSDMAFVRRTEEALVFPQRSTLPRATRQKQQPSQ